MKDQIIADPTLEAQTLENDDAPVATDLGLSPRIFYLDNLRTFMIFFVVIYHAGFVYTNSLAYNWIVVDPVKNDSIGLVGMYIDLFVMFTLFFISGFFIPRSLAGKTNWQFIKGKLKRILLPWLIGVLTMIPAYKALYLYSRGMPQEAWYTYFHIFNRGGEMSYLFSNNPTQHWLWFLPVLFMFQMVYLLLQRTGLLKFNISLLQSTVLIFVLGTAYGLLSSILEFRGWTLTWLLDFQNERLFIYFMVFLCGSLCYKLGVMDPEVRSKKQYLWANVGLTIGLGVYTVVALNLFFNMIDPNRDFYFISPWVDRLVYNATMMISMISCIYILVHSFKAGLNRTNPILNLLSNNSYDVYIIHLVVIGLVALPMIQLGLPPFAKFLILGVIAFIVSNLIITMKNRLLNRG